MLFQWEQAHLYRSIDPTDNLIRHSSKDVSIALVHVIKKIFEQHGIDLNSKEQMQQWRKRVVALDLGTGTIAVCASNGEEIELDFMDILLLSGDKETIKHTQQLKDNIAQAQYDYSKYQLSINPQLYNERGARLSIAELRAAKISTIERRDQMSAFLLNKLRRCHCDFAFFRHQQHFKLICALLPLGGSVRVEPMNYQGMAKRRQVKEGVRLAETGKTG